MKPFLIGGFLGMVSGILFPALTGEKALSASASPSSTVEQKVDELLTRMTLREKIGQMVQYSPGESNENEISRRIKAGEVGSLLNLVGAEDTNKAQKIAVEQTRLHIPLLFGLDVIHGFKTIFPIPLAEDCAWDPELLEKCEATA